MNWRSWLIAAIGVSIALAEFLAGASSCGWDFSYPLDDTYIHMALARELANSGTWGLEPGVPVFASSSPLWTVLLAVCFKVIGAYEWIPLALTSVCAFVALAVVVSLWDQAGMPVWAQFVFGIVLSLMIPTCTLINLGMEHALHVLCLVVILGSAWRMLSDEKPSRASAIWLFIATFLATATRYETLFVVVPIAAVLLGTGRWRVAIIQILAAASPIVTFGCYAMSQGGHFLPISILLKGNTGIEGMSNGICSLYCSLCSNTIHAHLAIVILMVVALIGRFSRPARLLAFSTAVAFGGHYVFAQLGWLYRYEAYLVGLTFMVLPLAIIPLLPAKISGVSTEARPYTLDELVKKGAMLVVVIFIAFPFIARGFQANVDTVLAQREIHAQQYQTGNIFATLPEELKGPIVLNDLGYVAWKSRVHILDLVGLGSPDVGDLALMRSLDCHAAERLVLEHKIRYAALYPNWHGREFLPKEFVPVAALDLKVPRTICGGDRVVFGVLNGADKSPFVDHLRAIEKTLPPEAKLVFF